jgi:predicted nuclease of restriction endonuclease-like (RecB) superfamily
MSPDSKRADLPAGEESALLDDLSVLIDAARGRAAAAVNTELLMLYWSVGKRVRDHILGGERAAYGAEILNRVAEQLALRYGRGFGWRNLSRMVKFAELYPDPEILSPLATKLTWTNVAEILALDDTARRDFYLVLSARERWPKRTLRAQIAGKLYERTVASRGGTDGIESETAALRESGTMAPALAFRDPYVLDFLGLPPEHSESDLENAILDEMQRFLIELGAGFAFVARQKRMVVDGRDYHLDLLFYHRGLGSLVAIELKARALEPGDFGQMTLYLRWLDKHDRQPGEKSPVGLILCARKGPEQSALLGLDDGEIRAAQYLTEPLREEMRRRLEGAVRSLPSEEG